MATDTQALQIADDTLSLTQTDFIIAQAKLWDRPVDEVKAMISASFPTLKTIGQLTVAFTMARKYDFDPFAKEIYAYIDKRGNLTIIVGKDGFLKVARKQP